MYSRQQNLLQGYPYLAVPHIVSSAFNPTGWLILYVFDLHLETTAILTNFTPSEAVTF